MQISYKILKYVAGAVFAFGFMGAKAQQNLTLYNMSSVSESMYVNPSQMPQNRLNIGIPVLSSVYLNFGNSGFRVTDFVKKGSDDSLHIDMNKLINTLHNSNYLTQSLELNLFSFGMQLKKNYITFSIVEKENISFTYPKNFINWAWQGNGAFLGQDMQFNFGLSAIHYREYGIGLARQLNDKLTLGIKAKYLYGMENIQTQQSGIVFNTGATDFDYSASDNIKINTSGIDSGSFSNVSAFNYLFGKGNSGMAYDFGATYQFNDKFTFSGSVIDLGYINWHTQVANYTGSGYFNFDGIDINQFASNSDSAIKVLSDSVKNTFNITTTHQSYTTMLPLKFYLGANYKISENKNAGVLFYGQLINKKLYSGMALSFNMKVKSWVSVSASYAYINRDFRDLGIGFSLTGPVQWYVVTDNVFGLFFPQSAKTINIRTGINLCFGRKPKEKPADKPANDDKSGSAKPADSDKTTTPPEKPADK